MKNYAFIDGQNLYSQIKKYGWKIDYSRFRIYLKEKYNIEKAYIFIGFVSKNSNLYVYLQEAGFILIFKETYQTKDGKIKGNVDAELVLKAMIELNNYQKAVIVSGDGDFACLVEYLRLNEKLETLLIPDEFSYSHLLRKAGGNKLNFINRLKNKISIKKEPQ